VSVTDIPTNRLPDRQLVERDLEFFLSASGIPAIGLDICVGGKRLNVAAGVRAMADQRPVTAASRFRISCLIKTFGAVVCLKLAEAGRLDIDAPVGEYLPEVGEGKGAEIRVRHLLSHTGGYRGPNVSDGHSWVEWSWDECARFFRDTPQLFRPGTVFNESHFDHVILGQIVSRVAGRHLRDLVRELIFEPLGIEAGTASNDMIGGDLYVYGHGFQFADKVLEEVENPGKRENDVWASSLTDVTLPVRDITTIGEALSGRAGRKLGNPILSAASREALLQTAVNFPRTFGAGLDTNWRPCGFNLAFAAFGGGQLGYFAVSQGQNCALVIDPRHATTVTMAINAAAVKLRVALLNCIFARMRGSTQPVEEFLRPPLAALDFDEFIRPFRAEELAGRYIGPFADDVIVTSTPHRIDFKLGSGMAIGLVRAQDNRLGMQAQSPVPIGIFQEPETGQPALFIGLYSFKKAA
jgi:CubicO group peptidase (beta-lactamase class C family)